MAKESNKWFEDSPITSKFPDRRKFNLHYILKNAMSINGEGILSSPSIIDILNSQAYYLCPSAFIDIYNKFLSDDIIDELIDTTNWDEDFEEDLREYAKEENLNPHNVVIIARCIAYAVGNLPEVGYDGPERRPIELIHLDDVDSYKIKTEFERAIARCPKVRHR